MIEKNLKMNSRTNSELRQDIVSGDWILNAPGRRRRPYEIIEKLPTRKRTPKSRCPFEEPQLSSGQSEPLLLYHDHPNWEVQVVPNKYPAVSHSNVCPTPISLGPYRIMHGAGHHELVITRDHDLNFAELRGRSAGLVFRAFKERYLILRDDPCVEYLSIFHNWGPSAGASVYHPHYQMIGVPVLPPDVSHSLRGSANYFAAHKKCVHCDVLQWEKKYKKRIVYENEHAIAFMPFASRVPFEVRIFPKDHLPYFEDTDDAHMSRIVHALQAVLGRISKKLNDADYNFFIHTAPMKAKKKYAHYHWHIEIIPKITVSAGFELGTGVDINVVDPEEAAKFLR